MATADELLAAAETTVASKILVIDNDLRTISIPAAVTLLGVEHDNGVHRMQFSMPRMYGEFDLSEFEVRINYLNAKGEGDIYLVNDAAVDGDHIVFSWLADRFAFKSKGKVTFIVCLRKYDEKGTVVKEFNTTLASLPVLEGLEVEKAIEDANPGIFESILGNLYALQQEVARLPDFLPVPLTQDEYDALVEAGTVNSDTLYLISGGSSE